MPAKTRGNYLSISPVLFDFFIQKCAPFSILNFKHPQIGIILYPSFNIGVGVRFLNPVRTGSFQPHAGAIIKICRWGEDHAARSQTVDFQQDRASRFIAAPGHHHRDIKRRAFADMRLDPEFSL